MTNAHSPDAVDVHVGARIRLRRTLLGFSQAELGEQLGITFQQVQKYEKGINRVSASRLFHAAQALKASVGYFFAGLAGDDEGEDEDQVSAFLLSAEGIELARAVTRIERPEVRQRLLLLTGSLAAQTRRPD